MKGTLTRRPLEQTFRPAIEAKPTWAGPEENLVSRCFKLGPKTKPHKLKA